MISGPALVVTAPNPYTMTYPQSAASCVRFQRTLKSAAIYAVM